MKLRLCCHEALYELITLYPGRNIELCNPGNKSRIVAPFGDLGQLRALILLPRPRTYVLFILIA